ncbi:MAG: hypothetical protein JW895_07510 [Thermoleophilaceae bacterium]|nr:hypothetical protein [Thermoleophilaceae bacterium]
MTIPRIAFAGAMLLSLVALGGCYGSTEPASDVGPERATFNGRGTANDGPASTVFEYWQTESDADHRFTPPLRWPADASGPFSQAVSGLAAGTSYSFRLCGADDGTGNSICAQTRAFTTREAVEDAALGGTAAGCCSSVSINAHADPDGARPRGSVRTVSGGGVGPRIEFNGFVSCLAVEGRRATIGALGVEDTLGTPPPNHFDANLLMTIVDGHTAGADSFAQRLREGHTPLPDCEETLAAQPLGTTGFVVNDAAGEPTAR